jgi:hypothetical protein
MDRVNNGILWASLLIESVEVSSLSVVFEKSTESAGGRIRMKHFFASDMKNAWSHSMCCLCRATK